MKQLITVLTLLSSQFFAATVAATENPNLAKAKSIVPEHIAGVDTLSAEQVVQNIVDNPELIVVDARIKRDRAYGYIENSYSLPDIETNCDSLAKLNDDKSRHMMFYCNGVQCGRSVVSIKVAKSCGYSHLSWFKGGFEEWKNKGYQYVKEN